MPLATRDLLILFLTLLTLLLTLTQQGDLSLTRSIYVETESGKSYRNGVGPGRKWWHGDIVCDT